MRPLLLAGALLLGACAMKVPEPERAPVLVVDSATVEFFTMLHRRAVNHPDVPNREIVLCLYGRIRGHEISIDTYRSPRLRAETDTSITYIPCSGPGYLGTWHTHPEGSWGDGCWHSAPDREAFHARPENIVALVTCRGGRILALVKKGYSRR